MFMLYAVPLGLLAGLALGGRVHGLGTASIRHAWLFVVALAVQVALFSTPLGEMEWAPRYGPYVYLASLGLVLVGLLLNLQGWGSRLLLVGAVCNLLVIAANGGRMPVWAEAARSVGGEARVEEIAAPRWLKNVSLMDETTRLWFLGDVFAMPGFVPLGNVFSIGDVLAGAGVAVWLVELMRAGALRSSLAPALSQAKRRAGGQP